MTTRVGVTYTSYTVSEYINVTALYVWMDAHCFPSMKQIFELRRKSQLHKGISVIKASVYGQNVLHLTYLLAMQLSLSSGEQLTVETF